MWSGRFKRKSKKATKINEPSEVAGSFPKASETPKPDGDGSKADPSRVRELEKEIFDLRITNRAKDMFIEQLQGEREGMVNQLVQSSRKVGELETRLLQLEEPKKPAEH